MESKVQGLVSEVAQEELKYCRGVCLEDLDTHDGKAVCVGGHELKVGHLKVSR